MAKRGLKKPKEICKAANPNQRLRSVLKRRTKVELIDVLVELANKDNAFFRKLVGRFDSGISSDEIFVATRLAISEATAFDATYSNYNSDYDYEAYNEVERNLRRLIESDQLHLAMELALELMRDGSYQVEMSDEGLMTEDIETCLNIVLKAVAKSRLSKADAIKWCDAMIKADRVGFICDQELRALRRRFEG